MGLPEPWQEIFRTILHTDSMGVEGPTDETKDLKELRRARIQMRRKQASALLYAVSSLSPGDRLYRR